MDLALKDQIVADLEELEQEEAEPVAAGERPQRRQPRKSLVCKKTEDQLDAELRWLGRNKWLIFFVSLADLLFIISCFFVLGQYLWGDVPKSSVTRVVYLIPIAGALLSSGAVGFLLNERRLSNKSVKELNEVFRRVCREA
ncbi:MAG: hypothetical protein H0U05_09975 [Actinobacteria bacterium]|nr:hypothetical protein [Actinomycetota bacterium]